MAPSPTGEFHIGGMRTLLYNWAFAQKHKGKFIIRIEDTDRRRFVEGASDRLLEVIKLYGLNWDEGPDVGGPHEPYVQSARLERYEKYAKQLIEQGDAYYCFCSEERLEKLRKEQRAKKIPPKYDKKCLDLSDEEAQNLVEEGVPHVIRLNVPENEEITFFDEVHGEISINTDEVDDQVLIKSDGYPTYHMGVVVDDHEMEVSHIIRGVEWLPSTPKHILLYRAFNWEIPVFAHLPLLKEVGSNQKMSKRHGDVHAIEFLEKGYLPEALINFLMFLGWNPGTEKEIYSLDEFVEDFSLENIHKTDLVAFDRKKLLWMNGQYIRDFSTEDLLERIKEWADRFDIDLVLGDSSKEYQLKVLKQVQDRLKLLRDFPERASFFFREPEISNNLLQKYSEDKERAEEILANFIDLYESVSDWEVDHLDEISHGALTKFGYSPKEAFMTIRVAVSGKKATPPLFDMLDLLGKEVSLKRLKKSIEILD